MVSFLFALLACGRDDVAVAPLVAAEGPTPAPPEVTVGDLLSNEPGAAGFEGLGMRGEGPQNGGPPYPSLADVQPNGRATFLDRYDNVLLTLGEPSVGPGISADALQEVLRRNSVQVRSCFSREWRSGARLGAHMLTVRFTLGAGGIDAVEAVRSSFPDDRVPSCVLDRIRRFAWPTPDADVVVEYPLTFTPS